MLIITVIIIGCWRYERVWCNCVRILLEINFVNTNIYQVTFEKDAEERVRLPVKCSLLLPDFCPKS